MNKKTKLYLRNENIYQVSLNQYPKEKIFESLILDLPRIKSLGMNYIYLTEINPFVLNENIKETLSFKEVNNHYGTLDDFNLLIKKALELDLKIMIDLEFYHINEKMLMVKENPSWLIKENGTSKALNGTINKVIKLDYNNSELQSHLINVLTYWISLGVKAFKFSNASLIPLSFWRNLNLELALNYFDILFVGESLDTLKIKDYRDLGFNALSDGELYEVFDILTDNDTYPLYLNYLKDFNKLNDWLSEVNKQEAIYPVNYIKLRSLENDKTERLTNYIKDKNRLLNLTGLLGYLKGTMLLYGGQEFNINVDNLIDFNSKDKDLNDLLHRVGHLRKDELFQTGVFKVHLQEKEVAVLSYENEMSIAYGVFNLGSHEGEIKLDLKDGVYQNILYPNQVKIFNGNLKLANQPMILFAMKRLI